MTNTVKLAITAVLLTITSIFTINALVRQKLPPNPAESCPSAESQYILYTLSACPHCENVHQYLKTNNIADKVKFSEKSADDPAANQEFLERAAVCGIPQDQIGVPLLWDAVNSKCVSGDQAIIDFFANAAGLTPLPQ